MKRIKVDLGASFDKRALLDQYSILGVRLKEEEKTLILEKPGLWRLVFDGKNLVMESEKLSTEKLVEETIDVIKLLYRYTFCAGCRACEPNCPTSAIRVTDKPRVDPGKCIACRICIDTCTIAEVYVEHVIVPLLFNKPLAWKRISKRKIEDTLEKEKTLLVQQQQQRAEQKKPEEQLPPTIF